MQHTRIYWSFISFTIPIEILFWFLNFDSLSLTVSHVEWQHKNRLLYTLSCEPYFVHNENARMTDNHEVFREKKKIPTKIIYFELNGFMFEINHVLTKWKTFAVFKRRKIKLKWKQIVTGTRHKIGLPWLPYQTGRPIFAFQFRKSLAKQSHFERNSD